MRRTLIATAALGIILAPLNATMVVVALPVIRSDFNLDYGQVTWLVSAYLVAIAVVQPIGGRLGDHFGNARVFRFGLWGFIAASIACAASPSFFILLVARIGQALAGAAIIPNGLAMVRRSAGAENLGRSMGTLGAVIALSAGAGPLIAALLLLSSEWRLIFVFSLLPSLGALSLIRSIEGAEHEERGSLALDWIAALLLLAVLGSGGLLLNVASGHAGGLSAAVAAAILASSTLLLLRREIRSNAPLLNLRLLRSKPFLAATMFGLLSNILLYVVLLSVPFIVTEEGGRSASEAGALLGGMSILVVVLSPFSGRISDSIGRRGPGVLGAILQLAGFAFLLVLAKNGIDPALLSLPLLLLGLGIGVGLAPATTAAIEAAPIDMAGAAAGLNSLMRYVGNFVGAGLLGASLASSSNFSPRMLSPALIVGLACGFALVVCATGLAEKNAPNAQFALTD
ncbi:MAG TPA: MFS transporter [Dehalococcoidia bacterium]|nr:MFS transporter [Dehalococcoidia bacterium]